ncbi:hypothetical protein GCM10017567_20010 [Amycolatopsis bullii]|uniref:Uncharacterized protein n=1 Tax=Amycolatopsis bullii TaxID=941987 RepID=A0ABQ3K6G0_9PSEU|nr:hypothetical protein GCM10017567_20010 [Amycolatopsis bullii]
MLEAGVSLSNVNALLAAPDVRYERGQSSHGSPALFSLVKDVPVSCLPESGSSHRASPNDTLRGRCIRSSGTPTSNRPVTEVICQVPPSGWQLRLGEHIFAKQQAEMADPVPRASEDRIEQARSRYSSVPGIDATVVEEISAPSARGNRLRLPEPEAILCEYGKPGCEAETRELLRLSEATGLVSQTEDDVANQGD